MRGLFLIVAAALSIANIGCGNQENRRQPPPQQASAPESAPRVNLYPLSAPPPGSNQPVQGYAPTRITAAQYTPDQTSASYPESPRYAPQPGYSTQPAVYTPPPTNYGARQVAYGPGAANPPFSPGTGGGAFTTASGGYCTVEDVTAYSNPNVPIGDPPVIINSPTGGVVYAGPANRSPLRAERQGLHYGAVEGTADIARPIGPGGAVYSGTSTYSAYPATGSGYSTTSYTPVATTSYAPPLSTTTTYGPVTTTTTTYSSQTTMTPTSYAPPLSTTTAYPSAYSSSPAALPASGALAAGQLRLVPAPDVPPGNRPGDAAPSQWFEIIRPDNGPLRIGRVSATCVCVGVRVPQRQIAAGERALIEARVLTRPPANNLTYGIIVNVVEPTQTVVDADITIRY